MPQQIVLIRAANTLNCSVFDLINQPIDSDYGNWVDWAMIYDNAESIVNKTLTQR